MTTTGHVHLRDIDFTYLEAGPVDGPLALCLHGFPDHAPTWNALLPELAAAGYHAVAPWTRGYAPTGLAPDGNYEVSSLALDAIALTEHFAGDRTDSVLIGHDWGAITAYTAVGHAPERFRRFVTMAVPHQVAVMNHFLTNPRQLQCSWYVFLFQTPFAEYAASNNDFALIDLLWSDWSPGFTPDPTFIRELKETFAAPGSLDAAIGYYRFMLGGLPGDPALEAVGHAASGPMAIPALYLHGTNDGAMLPEMLHREEMEPLFPAGLEFHLVPDTGHFLHLEAPTLINQLVLDFLAP
jgi:pimeloyl-ACP methyl ester carboxylesterase